MSPKDDSQVVRFRSSFSLKYMCRTPLRRAWCRDTAAAPNRIRHAGHWSGFVRNDEILKNAWYVETPVNRPHAAVDRHLIFGMCLFSFCYSALNGVMLLGTYCVGTGFQGFLNCSVYETMFLQFHTDYSITRTGFRFEFLAIIGKYFIINYLCMRVVTSSMAAWVCG